MLEKRIGSLVVLATLQVLIGCHQQPRPSQVPIVILVTPIYSPTQGYGAQQLVQPGQILQWLPMTSSTKQFWVEFDPKSNPCKNSPPYLYWTSTKPEKLAECEIVTPAPGQHHPMYSYMILDHEPTNKHWYDDGTTPCGGCRFTGGTPGQLRYDPDAFQDAPSNTGSTTNSSTVKDSDGQIGLSCDKNNAIKVRPPDELLNGVFWQADGSLSDWNVQFDKTDSQVPLCENSKTQQFTGDAPVCFFDKKASGTYTYSVTSLSNKCNASQGNIITIRKAFSDSSKQEKKKP